MNWQPIIKGKPRPIKGHACLLWIWDKEIRIGYVDEGQHYWKGDRWVDSEGIPTINHPDYEVTHYCILPNPRGRRSPERIRR